MKLGVSVIVCSAFFMYIYRSKIFILYKLCKFKIRQLKARHTICTKKNDLDLNNDDSDSEEDLPPN